MMKHLKSFQILMFLAVIGLATFWAQAETIEVLTFYPTQTDTQELDVGLLTADQIGIGIDNVNADALLQVIGQEDAISEVLFMRGNDTDPNDAVQTELRVGIDWGSPFSALHVHKGMRTGTTIRDLQLTLHENSSGTPHRRAGMLLRTADSTNTPIYAGIYTQKDTANSHKLHLDVGTNAGIPANNGNIDGTTATVMTLTNQGSVGIGTVDPQATLHVFGSVRFESAPFSLGGDGDTNGDNFITPIDVLLIVNALNTGTSLTPEQHVRADVNGDGLASGLDVNLIVDHINTVGNGGPPLTVAEREALKGRGILALSVDVGNNLGVGVVDPLAGIPAPPNANTSGNVNANDVYLRSSGQWASQMGGSSAPDVASTYTGNGALDRFIPLAFPPGRILIWSRHTGGGVGGHIHLYEKFRNMPILADDLYFTGDDPAEYSFRYDAAWTDNIIKNYLEIRPGENGFHVGTDGGGFDSEETNGNGIVFRYMVWR